MGIDKLHDDANIIARSANATVHAEFASRERGHHVRFWHLQAVSISADNEDVTVGSHSRYDGIREPFRQHL